MDAMRNRGVGGPLTRGPGGPAGTMKALPYRPKNTGQQFGQIATATQMGGGSTVPSLQELFAQRGFDAPAMQTGMQDQMMRMFKDPVTGENRTGGAHSANHANAMSNFYGQNPEALELAKQYNTDPTQFGGKPAPTRSLQQHIMPPIEMIQRPGGSASFPGSTTQRRVRPDMAGRGTVMDQRYRSGG